MRLPLLIGWKPLWALLLLAAFIEAASPSVAASAPQASGLRSGEGPVPVAPEVVARDADGHVTVRAVRTTEPIDVDGELRDQVYDAVLPISDFIQNVPDVGQAASQRTEVWVLFDEDSLYVSARCWDTAPESEWVANEMRRDGTGIINNDNFGVTLDTFHDRRNAFMFYTNPLGGMTDLQITNETSANRDWNTVWTVRTGRFAGGWTVEMQIPFKSLRYRPGPSQVWGIQFRRGIRRRNEWTFLTAVPAVDGSAGWNRISMFATLVGLEVPPGSKNLEIKPYAISGVTTDRTVSPSVLNDVSGDAGLDVKYGITQNLTLDLTYNTDFAQVEVDEQQINLTRFNLFFPEKREFFLEGRGLFEFGRGSRGGSGGGNTPELFFSRQIGLNRGRVIPIVAGGRLTGKIGRTSLGALNIETDEETVSGTPKTNFTVLRFRQDLLQRSSVGVLFTGRSRSTIAPGASSEAIGVDAAFSFYENVNFNGYYARVDARGLTGKRDSYQARFDYGADRYGAQIDYLVVGDDFRPDVGFVRRDDMRRSFVQGRFSPRLRASRLVRRFVWDASLEYIGNLSGQLETRTQSASFDTEFQSSDRLSIDAGRSYELLVQPFRVDRRATVPAGDYSFDRISASYLFGQQRRLSGSVAVSFGGFYDGEQTSVAFNQGRLEITPQLSLEPSISVNRVELPTGSFTAQLYRSRVTYAFNTRMFLAGLLQYNSSTSTLSANLRLRWEYIPGSELFLVYTEDQNANVAAGRFSDLLNRAFVVKVNRLLRF